MPRASARTDPDNPEWTRADFGRAAGPDSLSQAERAAFPRTGRGPQKAPTKAQITLRLDRAIVEHFRSTGPGWQRRINETLRAAVKEER